MDDEGTAASETRRSDAFTFALSRRGLKIAGIAALVVVAATSAGAALTTCGSASDEAEPRSSDATSTADERSRADDVDTPGVDDPAQLPGAGTGNGTGNDTRDGSGRAPESGGGTVPIAPGAPAPGGGGDPGPGWNPGELGEPVPDPRVTRLSPTVSCPDAALLWVEYQTLFADSVDLKLGDGAYQAMPSVNDVVVKTLGQLGLACPQGFNLFPYEACVRATNSVGAVAEECRTIWIG